MIKMILVSQRAKFTFGRIAETVRGFKSYSLKRGVWTQGIAEEGGNFFDSE